MNMRPMITAEQALPLAEQGSTGAAVTPPAPSGPAPSVPAPSGPAPSVAAPKAPHLAPGADLSASGEIGPRAQAQLEMTAALPAPAQFDAMLTLIRAVFRVPAVTIALHGAPTTPERGVFRAFLETPLTVDGEVIGALRILDTEPRDFTDTDCELLAGFARLVIEQVDLWAEASRDVLTGAMTRRAFTEALRKTFAARQRVQGKASLVYFDLDHFKKINDTHGHPAGDAVLRTVARAVLRELRTEDSFGRIGGEEFAIIVANAGAEAATEVAQRIRRAIETLVIPGFEHVTVSASFGVAEACDAMLGAEDWAAEADAQLYLAKTSGRNRVQTADPVARLHPVN